MEKTVNYLLLFFMLLLAGCEKESFSPEQSVSFVKFFGSYSADSGSDVVVMKDGGYLIVGTKTNLSSQSDIVVIKTDKYGNMEWEKCLGGNYNDQGTSIGRDHEQGFVLLGTTSDSTGKNSIYLCNISPDGTVEWETHISSASDRSANALLVLNDGYLILGNTLARNNGPNNPQRRKDILLLKTDFEGKVLWESIYGGSGDDFGNDILLDKQGYIIVGSSNSFQTNEQQKFNLLVLKISISGGLIDMSTYGGILDDYGHSVCLNEGGYVICGTTNSYAQNGSDLLLIKLNRDLRTVDWKNVYGSQGNDEGTDILALDNTLIAVGSDEITGGATGCLHKVDSQGADLFEHRYGGVGSQVINAIKLAPDGGFVFIGTSTFEGNSMITLTKTDSSGQLNQ